jgi:hypothetical protein
LIKPLHACRSKLFKAKIASRENRQLTE